MKKSLVLSIIVSLLAMSCAKKENTKAEEHQTKTSGTSTIVVDENLKHIIGEQKQVFEGLHPEANINSIYTGELNAYTLFMDDSIKTLFGTRPLSDVEKAKLKLQKRTLRTKKVAIEGVAIIVNKANPDTLMKLETLEEIMLGEITNWNQINPGSKLGEIQVVFDRPNSSTARFISDSILQKKPFSKNITAISDDFTNGVDSTDTKPNELILDYVINNKNAMGVLGVNWVSNPKDTTGNSFDGRINVVSLGNLQIDSTKYYKPYPAYLGLKWYPLSRDVYSMITDRNDGTAAGFVQFSVGENGQRIVNKSGLFPANVPTRLVRVDSKFDQ